MRRERTGEYITITTDGPAAARAFVPTPLPPDPELAIDGALRDLLDQAHLALGRLDSVTLLLPDPDLFLYTYVRKEAVLSSQIEGTQSSLSDLLLFEMEQAPGVPLDDVVEVSNYVDALQHGLERIRGGFPLSNRLLREMHGRLMARGRGADREPGEFRTRQNWIGGRFPAEAVFVPPPAQELPGCLAALERFLHDDPIRTPALLKAALAHVQFETIHPFLDGNGRLGRLLIALILSAEGVLREPLLYLSLYLRRNRQRYYELLNQVRSDGDWEAWIAFFAEGVLETATGAWTTAQRLSSLFAADQANARALGRSSGSVLQVLDGLRSRPLATVKWMRKNTGLSAPTIGTAFEALERLGIAREITGRKRNRVFAYTKYLALLNEGTEGQPG